MKPHNPAPRPDPTVKVLGGGKFITGEHSWQITETRGPGYPVEFQFTCLCGVESKPSRTIGPANTKFARHVNTVIRSTKAVV